MPSALLHQECSRHSGSLTPVKSRHCLGLHILPQIPDGITRTTKLMCRFIPEGPASALPAFLKIFLGVKSGVRLGDPYPH